MPARYTPPQTTSLEQLYSVNGVAGVIDKSRSFVYQLVRDGELSPFRVGQRLRFRASDVRAYLDRLEGGDASEISDGADRDG